VDAKARNQSALVSVIGHAAGRPEPGPKSAEVDRFVVAVARRISREEGKITVAAGVNQPPLPLIGVHPNGRRSESRATVLPSRSALRMGRQRGEGRPECPRQISRILNSEMRYNPAHTSADKD
jgi:hypothetical protein